MASWWFIASLRNMLLLRKFLGKVGLYHKTRRLLRHESLFNSNLVRRWWRGKRQAFLGAVLLAKGALFLTKCLPLLPVLQAIFSIIYGLENRKRWCYINRSVCSLDGVMFISNRHHLNNNGWQANNRPVSFMRSLHTTYHTPGQMCTFCPKQCFYVVLGTEMITLASNGIYAATKA